MKKILLNKEKQWWDLWFKIREPTIEERNEKKIIALTWIDLMIADKVLKPFLDKHHIENWHFHRRWGPSLKKSFFHEFSLRFESNSNKKDEMLCYIKKDPLIKNLKKESFIQHISCRKKKTTKDGSILWAGRKAKWSKAANNTFPLFVKTVSLIWLNWIEEYKEIILKKRIIKTAPKDTAKLIKLYENIEKRVKAKWMENGWHTNHHFISCVFGYEPIKVDKNRLCFSILSNSNLNKYRQMLASINGDPQIETLLLKL